MNQMNSKRNTKYQIIINTVIDADVNYSLKEFLRKIKNILFDKRGWRKLGYNFTFVSPTYFDIIQDKTVYKLTIRLSSNDTIENQCGFHEIQLSCFDPTVSPNEILINYDRWKNGSKPSKLDLENYRIYVINHEVGHALGRLHAECPCVGCKVPVMKQQTISIDDCSPNPWPLDYE